MRPAPVQGQRSSVCLSARDEPLEVCCMAGEGASRWDSPALCHSLWPLVGTVGCAVLTLSVCDHRLVWKKT